MADLSPLVNTIGSPIDTSGVATAPKLQDNIDWNTLLSAALRGTSRDANGIPQSGTQIRGMINGPYVTGAQATPGFLPSMTPPKRQTTFESIMPLLMKIIGYGV